SVDSGSISAKSFSGDGMGLTNLNASQLTSGTVALGQLPPAVVTNNSTDLVLSGAFSGNGSALTNVALTALQSGGAASAQVLAWNGTSWAPANAPSGGGMSTNYSGALTFTNSGNVFAGQ